MLGELAVESGEEGELGEGRKERMGSGWRSEAMC